MEIIKDILFVLRSTWYMCNVIQYSDNYQSLRKK